MTNNEAYSWITQPGIQATLFRFDWHTNESLRKAIEALRKQAPKKPNETTDRAWGIECKQAVCPNCDCYLGMVHFICEGDKKKITYCESCGQAIDWEGWKYDD